MKKHKSLDELLSDEDFDEAGLAPYYYCTAVSFDMQVALYNRADDWRCHCDTDFESTAQGYSMTPKLSRGYSLENVMVHIGDTMKCGRCDRIYTLIEKQVYCSGCRKYIKLFRDVKKEQIEFHANIYECKKCGQHGIAL